MKNLHFTLTTIGAAVSMLMLPSCGKNQMEEAALKIALDPTKCEKRLDGQQRYDFEISDNLSAAGLCRVHDEDGKRIVELTKGEATNAKFESHTFDAKGLPPLPDRAIVEKGLSEIQRMGKMSAMTF